MGYKIIASDLDGTLNNKEGKITPENIEAIQRAVAEGIKFVICSGRSFESIARYGAYAGLNKKGCYGIAFNGSVVYEADTMKILHEERMPRQIALNTIKKIKAVNRDIPIMAYAEGNLVIFEHEAQEVQGYAERSGIQRKKIDSFETYLEKDVLKLIIKYDHESLQEVYDNLIDQLEEGCSMFFSDASLLEFSTSTSNKAVGIKVLADYLGVDMKEVVAVGDNYNDLEMVKEAGYGVAVQNAVDALKDTADYITKNDHNSHAIAEVIDHILNSK